MTRDEAMDVLESIKAVYPSFRMTEKKSNILIPALKEMDYDGVMAKLSEHVATSPFAPMIADIAVYPKMPNDHLEQRHKWRDEAENVSPDVKRRFHDAMWKLVNEKKSETPDSANKKQEGSSS